MLVHARPFLQCDDDFWCGWFVAEGTVAPFGVVVLAPLLDDDRRFRWRGVI